MKVTCPICVKEVEWSEKSPYRPFCSKQCQLIDLGEWASEDRKIDDKSSPADLPDEAAIEAMLQEQEADFFKH
ncbi:DNA gyrase inhibitor YacG [Alteromonas sp. CYL-A6]|uniref:DNA gyrase inhibitor YacG n=1 Tax=Alteromonas nitratireducens TaxID=3390813 RepID=UPI00398315A0